jgi:hypothetical protein
MRVLTLSLCKIFFPVPTRNFGLLCLCLICCLTACNERTKTMSFYYWKADFSLDSMEENALRNNSVHNLYVRYLDVDWSPDDTAPVPVSQLRYDGSPGGYTVIPVVSVRNRVFEKLLPAAIPSFAAGVFARVRGINATQRLQNHEIQFDCDWTEKTKENYFAFLRQYHRISVQSLSSAIRMSQIRYSDKTGIPPVDYGVLFYFSIASTDSGDERSVYERSAVHHYTPSLRAYPLTLDVALPIFSVSREAAAGQGSKGGEDLMEIVTDINRHSNHHIRNLIYFDLDRKNLQHYDSNVFKEVLDRID